MQPLDKDGKPLSPLEPLDVEKLKSLLEQPEVDSVKVVKIPMSVGKRFAMDGFLFEVTKVLSGRRYMVKCIGARDGK